ncbi:MAG: class I SAM-dependent methyltransferase [Desulfobacca sp.]|uniref:class I SAM-dependent methyltransferase n=1 Tax=Desulfobacca sp. TaxID=2067990 RepID=UPI0040490CA2
MTQASASAANLQRLERYYRLQAKIYDLSRWSFLFGRGQLLRLVATHGQPQRILEVGCGTGHNLVRLRRFFPTAELTGLDLSEDMLVQARRKLAGSRPVVSWRQQAYDRPLRCQPPFELLLFSYVLTLCNPGWEEAIAAAQADLAPGGLIAVVDFHTSPLPLLVRWLALNHVRVAGELLPALQSRFRPRHLQIRRAYAGLWDYFLFIGQKDEPAPA